MTNYLNKPLGDLPGNASLRMFCFHHAGGSASLYRDWQRALGNQVEVVPVLLPGRDQRFNEKRFLNLDTLIEDIAPQLAPYLETPHVFFGHSMGALIAYKLACYRYANGRLLPRMLFISSCAAPQLPSVGSMLAELDDMALLKRLSEIGGVPEQLLSYPEFLDYMMPILRDDLTMCGSYQRQKNPIILPCPFHLFGGADDSLTSEDQLRAWSPLSSERSDLSIFPGGHFYLKDTPDLLNAELRVLLRQHTRPERKVLEHVPTPLFSRNLSAIY